MLNSALVLVKFAVVGTLDLKLVHGNFVVGAETPCACRGGSAQSFQIAIVNCTSLMATWQSILESAVEFNVVLETRTNHKQQEMLSRRARAKQMNGVWAAPVQDNASGTTAGKSGGILVLAHQHWSLEVLDGVLELEAPRQHYCLVDATNNLTNEHFHVLAYYGHPEARTRTIRDLRRAAELQRMDAANLYIAGDFNLGDDDIEEAAADAYVDAAAYHAYKVGLPPEPTFVGPVYGYSRPDRLLAPYHVAECIEDVNVVKHFGVPGHMALMVTMARRTTMHLCARALPPLEMKKKRSFPNKEDFLARTNKEWSDRLAHSDVNELYTWWSETWEEYIVLSFEGNEELKRGRGRSVRPTPAPLFTSTSAGLQTEEASGCICQAS